jgi:restriction system protein
LSDAERLLFSWFCPEHWQLQTLTEQYWQWRLNYYRKFGGTNLPKSEMEIFVFLFGLGCLVLFVWAIAFFSKLVADRKYRRPSRPQGRSPSAPPKSNQQISPVAVQPRNVIALKRSPVSARVRLPSNKHQQYIRLAERVLEQLRSGEVQLPKALGILRKMNSYAFEELLLTCCHKQVKAICS